MSDYKVKKVVKKSEVVSPVLTAQERKKLIKERHSLQRSRSLPIRLSDSFPARKRHRTENSIAKLPIFDSSNNIRRRNSGSKSTASSVSKQLFVEDDSKDGEKTKIFSSDSFSEISTTDQNNAKRKMGKSGSLFGRVMQRAATVDCLTPTKKKNQSDDVQSPSRHMARQLASPGELKMLQMLNSVNSPFASRTPVSGKTKQYNEENSSLHNKDGDEWIEISIEKIVDWRIKQSLCLECHPSSCLSDLITFAREEWNNAIQYWQYPSKLCMNETNVSLESDNGISKITNIEDDVARSPSMIAQKLVDAVRGPNAYVHQLIQSDEGIESFRRFREWQNAFSSLYNLWLNKIDDGDNQAYFYAITANEQIILFRPRVTNGIVTPVILFHSSSAEFRERLMSRDLTLYLPQGRIFRESLFERPSEKSKSCGDSLVKTDLEALRKAQIYGENPGVHVNVKIKKKRISASHAEIPPLYISGYDDCASFFTIFLNQKHSKQPFLLSRIGSFQNATQKSLFQFRRWCQEDIGHIELRGPVLPCAVTALLRATATCMEEKKKENSIDDVLLQDDIGLGSHYFVIQTKSNIQNATYSFSRLKLSAPINDCLPADDEDTILDKSNRHRGADVFVWNISRPNVKTFKMTDAEI